MTQKRAGLMFFELRLLGVDPGVEQRISCDDHARSLLSINGVQVLVMNYVVIVTGI